MHIFLIIIVIFTGLIALLLIMALFMTKQHYVKREITINATCQNVFDYVKLLKNQDTFNKHAMAGPDRKKEYRGIDGTVGYIYAWSGNKSAGEGEKEIKNLVEGKKIEMEIRFTKPMKVSATIIMETEVLPNNQTRVTWSNGGNLNYPVNVMIPLMKKAVAKDMDSSLSNLKNILEK
jgi:hypothetical protein